MLQDLQQSVSAFVEFVRDQQRNSYDRSPHTVPVAMQKEVLNERHQLQGSILRGCPLVLNVVPLPIIS